MAGSSTDASLSHSKTNPNRASGRSSFYSHNNDTEEDTSYNNRSDYDDEKHLHRVRKAYTDSSDSCYKSISHEDHVHHKFYKPTANRSWVLCAFLLVIGACILLLELALRTHPNVHDVPKLQQRHLLLEKRDRVWSSHKGLAGIEHLVKRQDEVSAQSTAQTTPQSISSTSGDTPAETISTTGVTTTAITTTVSVGPGSPNLENGLTITSDPPTIAPNPTNQISITTSNERYKEVTTTTSQIFYTPAPSDRLTISSSQSIRTTTTPLLGSPAPDSQITITTSNQLSRTSSTVLLGSPAPNFQVTLTESTSPVTAAPESQVKTTSTSRDNKAVATPSNKDISVQASIISGSIIASGTSVIGTLSQAQSAQSVVVSTLRDSNGHATATVTTTGAVPTGSALGINSLARSPTVLTDANGQATATIFTVDSTAGIITLTGSDGKPSATVTFTGEVTLTDSSGKPTATVSYGDNSASLAKQEATSNEPFTQFHYFLAMYLPNIISVVLQSSWLVVFATFKMMEPFYQLAQHGGASAKTTLTADYLSSGLSLSFFKVVSENTWVMTLAGLIQLALAVVVMLDSGMFNVVPTAFCKTEVSDRQPCSPVWVIHLPMVRTVEVLLIGCFSIIVSVIVLNRRRHTGVYTDPSKIATMADLLVHKPLIQEIRDLPASAKQNEIALDLQESRYALGTFVQDGQEQYGIIKVDSPTGSYFISPDPWYVAGPRRFGLWWDNLTTHIGTLLPFFEDFVCMSIVVVLFAMILAYRLLGGENLFNSWMNSGRIGPRIVLSALACCVSFLIKHKERNLRLSHPYVMMAKRSQPAAECITAGTQATAFTSLFKSMRNLDVSLALMAISVIFSDIVLILIPGIPQTPAQTAPVYLSSTYACLGMLAIVFMVHVRVTFKEWSRGHNIECPDTLAAVLMRLCASQFVEEKNSLEARCLLPDFGQDDDAKQHSRYDGAKGERRYRFGAMEGVDGVQRYMVDEDVWERRIAKDSTYS